MPTALGRNAHGWKSPAGPKGAAPPCWEPYTPPPPPGGMYYKGGEGVGGILKGGEGLAGTSQFFLAKKNTTSKKKIIRI